MKKKRPHLLSCASAYYRVAAKAERAGNYRMGEHYRKVADGFIRRHNDNKAYAAKVKKGLA